MLGIDSSARVSSYREMTALRKEEGITTSGKPHLTSAWESWPLQKGPALFPHSELGSLVLIYWESLLPA